MKKWLGVMICLCGALLPGFADTEPEALPRFANGRPAVPSKEHQLERARKFARELNTPVTFVLKHNNYSRAFVNNIMSEQPITISLYVALPLEKMDIEEDDMEADQTRESYAMDYFEYLTRLGLANWFDNVLNILEEQSRTAEFADVLPVLERGGVVQFMHSGKNRPGWTAEIEKVYGPAENFFPLYDWGSLVPKEDEPSATLAQINVVMAYKENIQAQCHSDADGCTIEIPNTDSVLMIVSPISERILQHEWGHVFGLKDLYEGSKTRPKGREIAATVMDSSVELTCADADALVYAMDEWTAQKAQQEHPTDYADYLSARILNGWKSFCSKDTWYKPLEMTKKIEGGAL